VAVQNVEIVREAFRRFESEDFEGLEELWGPDASLTGPEGWPEPGPFVGRDAVMRQFRRLASDMGEHHFTDLDFVTETENWIVLRYSWEMRGAGSGAGVATKLAGALRLEDGHLVESHFRWTPEEALEAAGLTAGR
jgi:ketosteroid isomerase-like protein